MRSVQSMLVTLVTVSALAGCSGAPLQAAHDCFQSNGLFVFDGYGAVNCVDEVEYALSKEPGEEGLVSVTVPEPGLELP